MKMQPQWVVTPRKQTNMYACSVIYFLFKHAVSILDYAVQNNGMIVGRSKSVGRCSKIVNNERESKNISGALYANIKY